MYSLHQNSKRLALKAFEVHHIPLLKDHLSQHEIDELKQLNHIQIQDIGKKVNKVYCVANAFGITVQCMVK